jgi:hypothetical protein
VATGVLGTGRAGTRLPTVHGAPASLLEGQSTGDPARDLLRTAAVLSVYERAGRRTAAEAGREALPPSAADDLPPCSRASAIQLARILHGEFRHLLSEWCQAASAGGRRAPNELLPALLDRLAANPAGDDPAAIRRVLGRRGEWLASLNPAWQATAIDEPLALWRNGVKAQRLATLRATRARDAAAARDLVTESWAQESPDDRAEIVLALGVGLSPDDESFLESVLDDKRKPVRQAAAELLARLPASAYAQRMTTRIASALTMESAARVLRRAKLQIDVALPDKPDKAAQRDSLELKPRGSMGERAHLLCQMLAATPLTQWNPAGFGPDDIVEAANATQWSEPLLRGWAAAAVRQRDPAWAEPLLKVSLGAEDDADCLDAAALIEILGADARERVLRDPLKGDARHRRRGLLLLEHCTHAWSVAFSQTVLAALQAHFGTGVSYHEHDLRLAVKQHIARRMSPSLAAEAEQGWDRASKDWHKGDEEMATTLAATLAFRRAMLEELSR